MSPIAGFTRFRRHQIGEQSAILTPVAATRVVPWRGAIEIDPAREFPDVDAGSLDPILSPLEGAKSVTGAWDGPLAHNDITYVYAAGLMGGISPTTSGTAKTWVFQVASLTADVFDYFVDEWGDDTNASDGITAFGGVLDSFTAGFGDTLGVYELGGQTVYAGATMATARTGALNIDTSPIWIYGADTEIYLDTAAGSIGTTKLVDAIHGAELSVSNNLDQKRFANGSNSRFNLAGYGRGEREITLALTVAKTAATMAERATIDDSPATLRFIEVKETSPSLASAGLPYANSWRLPGYLMSATDGEIGGNSTITLTYRAVYNSTLLYAFRASVVNTLAAL